MTLRTSLIITGDTKGARNEVRQLGTDVDGLTTKTKQLAKAQGEAERSAARHRAASVQLGQQFQDIGVQLQAGTGYLTIFAQQGGQVATALAGMGGKLGSVAGVIAGPWGAAISFGAILLGQFLSKTEDVTKAKDKDAEAAKTLTGATQKLNEVTGALTRSKDQEIDYWVRITEQRRLNEIQTRKNIQAELELARARLAAADKENGGDGGINFGVAVGGGLERRIRDLEAKLAANQRDLTAAEQAARGAVGSQAIRNATETREERAKRLYDNREAELNQSFARGEIKTTAELTRAINEAKVARDAEVKAAKDQAAARRESESAARRETATLSQMRKAILDLYPSAQITSGLRTRAQQDALIARGVTKATNSRHLTGNAVDIAPIAGVSFEEFVASIKARGFTIVEAKNEHGGKNDGTGAHWHIAWSGGREAVSTLNDMRQAEEAYAKQLKQDLDTIVDKYDPARKAANEYADALERINRLVDAGKLTQAEGIDYSIRAMQAEKARVNKLTADRSDAMYKQLGIDPAEDMRKIVAAIDNAAEAAGYKMAESFQRNLNSGLDGIAGAFGNRVAQVIYGAIQRNKKGGLANFISGVGEGSEAFRQKTADMFDRIFSKIFGSNGAFAQTVGTLLAGAQLGSDASSIVRSLGVKQSKLGAQIGGAIGGAIAGPVGSIVGGVLGGTVGGLFKKAKQGSVSISSVNGDLSATGNSGAAKSAALSLGKNVQSGLQSIADLLGGQIGAFNVVVGQRNGDFRVRVGQGSLKVKKGAKDFGEDEAAANAYAIQLAISQGAVTGLSAAVQKALGSSSDLDKALKEAVDVQSLETALGGVSGAFEKAFKDFDRQAAERVRIARQYGFDVLKVEELNAKDRLKLQQKLLDEQVGSLQRLVDELTTGSLFEGSAVDQRTALLDKIAKTKTDFDNGVEGAGDTLASLFEQLNSVSKAVFGTTGGFANDRSQILDGARAAIASVNSKLTAASDPALATTNAALDENNDQNAQIISALGLNNQLLQTLIAAGYFGATGTSRLESLVRNR